MTHRLSRRDALRAGACGAALALGAVPRAACAGIMERLFGGGSDKASPSGAAPETLWEWSKEAYDYVVRQDHVECTLCPTGCRLKARSRGRCRVRAHVNGKLYSLVYGNPAAVHIDPMEKKPLYHFMPRSATLSLGFAGCNLHCLNCQNWELSQKQPEELRSYSLYPAQAVELAIQRHCRSISFTYNEPSVVYEYMLDTARKAHASGIRTVWVSNGYINRRPLEKLCEVLDAANVDLKAFCDEGYRALAQGTLQPVLDTLKLLKERDVWFEITMLIVPTYSDDIDMIRRMCGWIVTELGPDYPLHFSRFHPQHRLDHLAPTPPAVLLQAREVAQAEGLRYVYVGNYRSDSGQESNTVCPGCGSEIVTRVGYSVTRLAIDGGACAQCGVTVAGRW